MKIDPDKIIKTEPRMVKQGVEGPSLFFGIFLVILIIKILKDIDQQ
jgi:hypothetical protein